MKKLTLILVAALTLGLASCGESFACYKITTTYTLSNGEQLVKTKYVYGKYEDIENTVALIKQEIQKQTDNYNVTKERLNLAAADCYMSNW